jgi:DNA-binding NtrC family response regulator
VRGEPAELVARGVLLAELHACFAATLRVPPLRERREDLPSLLLLALDRSSRVLGRPTVGLDPHAHARLLAHTWHGNLAELESVVERAVLACSGARIGPSDLVPILGPDPLADERSEHELDGPLESIERRALQHALARTAGNKSEAARLLGLKRTTFLDKLRRHGLDERSTPPAPQ